MPFRIRLSSSVKGRPSTCQAPIYRLFPDPGRLESRSRFFHSTRPSSADATTHYETLGIQPGASQADVKKAYYKLSKSTHPDRNPNDPTAATRFSAVSDAYATLGNPDKRARYDRDVLRTRDPVPSRSGSHSSTQSGPVGGRSASGLSKRKSPFRGPPKSFYDTGGYGRYGDKRAADAAETAANARKRAGDYWGDAGPAGGFSAGQGAPRGFDNDVPHFDREGHYRTQENVQERFAGRGRVREEDIPYDGTAGGGVWSAFFLVSSVMGLGILLPSFFFGPAKKNEKDEK